jgi:predicted double-glycine peptidase
MDRSDRQADRVREMALRANAEPRLSGTNGETAILPPNLVSVPIVQQKQDFSCGAAATLLVLRYWRAETYAEVDESALYTPLHTTNARGTEPEPMVELFRSIGLEANYRTGGVLVEELERAVDAREPPVVDLQAWKDHEKPWRDTWDAGHYVVMIGYDEERLYFADPSRATPNGYAFLPRLEFEERWHDLTGHDDAPAHHMTIFVRGATRWRPGDGARSAHATRLG